MITYLENFLILEIHLGISLSDFYPHVLRQGAKRIRFFSQELDFDFVKFVNSEVKRALRMGDRIVVIKELLGY